MGSLSRVPSPTHGSRYWEEPMTKYKSVPIFGFKAVDGQPGVYEAYVAVFGNVDLVNDRIIPGAFVKSIQRWKQEGSPIPVIFSHQWDTLDAHVGEVLQIEERGPGDDRLPEPLKNLGGLWTQFQVDADDAPGKKMMK